VARPALHAWATADRPLRLVDQTVAPNDPDPVALACYGLLVRLHEEGAVREEAWLRFSDGQPVSAVSTQFLAWCCENLAARGKRALLLVWDNAPWQVSKEVRTWIRGHNQQVKQTGPGVRIIACYLPIKSPWLNPIEPRWIHSKRKIVAPARLLSAHEVEERVCSAFPCPSYAHLSIPEKVA
jgi:transposase